MSMARIAILAGGGLLGGAGAAWAWLTLPTLSPFSERLWTALNRLLVDQPPGVASDLELLLVFVAGAVLTGTLLALASRGLRR